MSSRIRVSLLVTLIAACTPRPPTEPSRPPERPIPTTEVDAGEPWSGDAPSLQPGASDPATVSCVSTRCRAGTETCCVYSDVGRCVKTAPPGPHDRDFPLDSQAAACGESYGDSALTDIRLCDESSDCPSGEACCRMFQSGGSSGDYCVQIRDPKRSPCDFSELCVVDSTCRVEGARCAEGECKKPVEPMCNGTRCSGDASACCGNPPSCRAPSACTPDQPRYRCTSPGDCLPGEHCALDPAGSRCTSFVDIANTARACDPKAPVCPPDALCKRYVCKPSSVPDIHTCQCP